MKEKYIYTYQTEKGRLISFIKLDLPPIEERITLISENNKMLTDGKRRVTTIQVLEEDKNKWIEVEKTEEEKQEEEEFIRTNAYQEMLDIITGQEEG